jgi:hypothetical protein
MSYDNDYTYANTCAREGSSAPEMLLEDEHSKEKTFSDGGDSNVETSSDEENTAIGTSSDKDDSNTKTSPHENCDASADSTSDWGYGSFTESSSGEEDAKVSSRSLSEVL